MTNKYSFDVTDIHSHFKMEGRKLTMEFLYVVVIVAVLIDSSRAIINCESNACTAKGQQNILCEYPDFDPSPDCGEVISWGVSQQEIEEIIHTHNNMRSYIAQGLEVQGNPGPQPPATDMQIMLWDEELAGMAQRWSNLCQSKIVQCVDVQRFPVGDSGAVISTGGKTLDTKVTDILKAFYEDVKHMNATNINHLTKDNSSKLYTQLVWSRSYKVGCGQIKYRQSDGIIRHLMTCLYGPRGNVVGERVYRAAPEV